MKSNNLPKVTRRILPKSKAAPAPAAEPTKPGKCQAKEVGHRRCNCGGPHCGANIGQP